MSVETAYQYLFEGALIWLGILLLIMLIRAIIGPRVTDRILAINMIGTMVSSCICILASLLKESYLIDMAMLYAMISFVTVLIMAATYIPQKPERGKFADEEKGEAAREKAWMRNAGKRPQQENVQTESVQTEDI